MAETATQCLPQTPGTATAGRRPALSMPPTSITLPINTAVNKLRSHWAVPTPSPVNQNGSFEFDRVLKSGYVQKRTQKTKVWKTIYLVLRPNALYMYKSEKESKLRQKLYLSDLSAVVSLKDPKQKRNHLMGLFSPARNYHFEAPSAEDAQEWIDLVRQAARIEEEEEEMFLASPIIRRQSFAPASVLKTPDGSRGAPSLDQAALMSSSPEPFDRATAKSFRSGGRRQSHHDYSGLSANEVASQSDISDAEGLRGHGASFDSFTVPSTSASGGQVEAHSKKLIVGDHNASQVSGLNVERDPDRVVWQGWLWFLKGKRGMRKWKNCWAVLRPRNMILYKDGSEYTALFILPLGTIVNVVDIDPVSKTKVHCMQIITDEKSYRFCAHDEESLVHCLGAFKSLLSRRKELEARASVSRQGTAPVS
ncbi:PH-domain-containing protein [Astrocystis sublimbata]|nr:PH-domain-containing protein [Astrocystis sublimbata]